MEHHEQELKLKFNALTLCRLCKRKYSYEDTEESSNHRKRQTTISITRLLQNMYFCEKHSSEKLHSVETFNLDKSVRTDVEIIGDTELTSKFSIQNGWQIYSIDGASVANWLQSLTSNLLPITSVSSNPTGCRFLSSEHDIQLAWG